jgi:hypothetical protein
MLRWFLVDLRTGRGIVDIRPMRGTFSSSLNEPETMSATLDLQDPETLAKGVSNVTAPAKMCLCVADGENIIAAGPIWARTHDVDKKTLTVNAKGLWSYFDHRYILPAIARTLPVSQFIVPDPADPKKTVSNPLINTSYQDLWLGTIAKRLVQQARAWTGGNVPVVFQDDEFADHVRNWAGVEFENLGDALTDLTGVEGGPDIMFQPRLTEDRLGVEWVLVTGTVAKPQIGSDTDTWLDVTIPKSAVSGLTITENASDVASLAWLTGGASSESLLVSRSYDATLPGFGFALFETLDSSHSSVEYQSTLDDYAAEQTLYGRGPTELWKFKAEWAAVAGVNVGDYVTLVFDDSAPPIHAGEYRQRVISRSGDQDAVTVGIECAPSK